MTYDDAFNGNEWFILIALVLGAAVIAWLPARFPVKHAVVYCLFGSYCGKFFDHTISLYPLDYYDVNDSSSYEWFDFLSYLIYAPFGYVFVYVYDKYRICAKSPALYILIWSVLSVAVEWIGLQCHVYHYKNGYKTHYSFLIYIALQTVLLFIYRKLKSKSGSPVPSVPEIKAKTPH